MPPAPRVSYHAHAPRHLLAAAVLLALAVLALAPRAVLGQATPQPQAASAVKVDVVQMGVGGKVREGSWAGFLVRLTDSAAASRDVIVRLSLRDVDGDTPTYTDKRTLNPGVAQPVWLYARVPNSFEKLVLTVHASTAGGLEDARRGILGEPLAPPVILGDQRGGKQLLVSDKRVGFIARTGSRPMGLSPYGGGPRSGNRAPLLGHERTEIGEIRSAADLPDSWLGLAVYDLLVWGAGEPDEVKGEYAAALREWVYRGGHLVIVLPPAGQRWVGVAPHELSDIMPDVIVTRSEGVDLNPLARLLSRDPKATLPADAVLQTFEPRKDATPGTAIRVLSTPEPQRLCVAARRIVGAGMVTLVGVDLTQRSLFEAGGFSPDVFWHRVLGRRGELPTSAELTKIDASKIGDRPEVTLDKFIAAEINKKGYAVAGILLGFVVFVAYWLVAGPLSYMLLKKLGKPEWSWIGYVASAALFTGIAWGGAALIRPAKLEATHLSLYEGVYGQDVVRAHTWASVMVPWYGTADISLGGPEGKLVGDGPRIASGGRLWHNALAPWDEIDLRQTATDRAFPDTREYAVDGRFPDRMAAPARSTVKQIEADWAGGTLWRMPYPVTDSGEAGGELRLDARGRLTGKLKHGLPGELHNVMVVLVQRQTPLPEKPTATDGANCIAETVCIIRGAQEGPWKPGEEYDVGSMINNAIDNARTAEKTILLDDKMNQSLNRASYQNALREITDSVSIEKNLQMLAFYSQLAAPRSSDKSTDLIAAQRAAMHGWDLGKWLTQPCVIVVGELGGKEKDAPSPIPLFVGGREVPTLGRTSVRWIYPLPDNPPAFETAPRPKAGGQ